jgi:hypothetical protein
LLLVKAKLILMNTSKLMRTVGLILMLLCQSCSFIREARIAKNTRDKISVMKNFVADVWSLSDDQIENKEIISISKDEIISNRKFLLTKGEASLRILAKKITEGKSSYVKIDGNDGIYDDLKLEIAYSGDDRGPLYNILRSSKQTFGYWNSYTGGLHKGNHQITDQLELMANYDFNDDQNPNILWSDNIDTYVLNEHYPNQIIYKKENGYHWIVRDPNKIWSSTDKSGQPISQTTFILPVTFFDHVLPAPDLQEIFAMKPRKVQWSNLPNGDSIFVGNPGKYKVSIKLDWSRVVQDHEYYANAIKRARSSQSSAQGAVAREESEMSSLNAGIRSRLEDTASATKLGATIGSALAGGNNPSLVHNVVNSAVNDEARKIRKEKSIIAYRLNERKQNLRQIDDEVMEVQMEYDKARLNNFMRRITFSKTYEFDDPVITTKDTESRYTISFDIDSRTKDPSNFKLYKLSN